MWADKIHHRQCVGQASVIKCGIIPVSWPHQFPRSWCPGLFPEDQDHVKASGSDYGTLWNHTITPTIGLIYHGPRLTSTTQTSRSSCYESGTSRLRFKYNSNVESAPVNSHFTLILMDMVHRLYRSRHQARYSEDIHQDYSCITWNSPLRILEGLLLSPAWLGYWKLD